MQSANRTAGFIFMLILLNAIYLWLVLAWGVIGDKKE
jgi:hypothetical protein